MNEFHHACSHTFFVKVGNGRVVHFGIFLGKDGYEGVFSIGFFHYIEAGLTAHRHGAYYSGEEHHVAQSQSGKRGVELRGEQLFHVAFKVGYQRK